VHLTGELQKITVTRGENKQIKLVLVQNSQLRTAQRWSAPDGLHLLQGPKLTQGGQTVRPITTISNRNITRCLQIHRRRWRWDVHQLLPRLNTEIRWDTVTKQGPETRAPWNCQSHQTSRHERVHVRESTAKPRLGVQVSCDLRVLVHYIATWERLDGNWQGHWETYLVFICSLLLLTVRATVRWR
jgi:hypothetical protein